MSSALCQIALALLLLQLPPALAAVSEASPPQRIASTNLCTDSLLLELVEHERIVSLSYWVADPAQSLDHHRVASFALNRGLAEELLPLQPDLVLTGRFSALPLQRLLPRLGIPVAAVDVPASVAEMRSYIMAVGEQLGEVQRAHALSARIESDLADLRQTVAAGAQRPRAVIYGPQGVTAGTGTLPDQLLAWAGYRNVAAELGLHGYVVLPLEALVRAAPDVLIFSNADGNAHSLAHRVQAHPALLRLAARAHRIDMPSAMTACVGPATVAALALLVGQRP